VVYAIVRAGGRQERVSVGDTIVINRLSGEQGDTVELAPVLLVDGTEITSDAAKLAEVKVTGEIVGESRGPKIRIMQYKNKTGSHRRKGHRQDLTSVKITGIK
jgi:large subunit ribosomal protein L21